MSPTSNAPSGSPGRLIVVVPRHDTKLYAYLQRSFSQAPDIEVVLDRRAAAGSDVPVTNPDLRRRSGARSLLGGLTLATAAPPRPAEPIVKEPEPPTVASSRPRLWPTLRPNDFTLVIPEADPNSERR